MEVFYDAVVKMRENGRTKKQLEKNQVKTSTAIKDKPTVEKKKTTETVVNDSDKGTSRKS